MASDGGQVVQRSRGGLAHDGLGVAVEVVLLGLAVGGEGDRNEDSARGLIFFGTWASRAGGADREVRLQQLGHPNRHLPGTVITGPGLTFSTVNFASSE